MKRTFSPLTLKRWQHFQANRRAFWSLWIFLAVFIMSLFAEFIANDKPLLIIYDKEAYLPMFRFYPEKTFEGDFETEADYKDPYIQEKINAKGWMIWPLIRYKYDTVNYDLPTPAPSRPTSENLLGTDDQGRDVLARLI